MKLANDTIVKLQVILDELKKKVGNPVEDICGALWNDGVRWDIAVNAWEKREPEDFFSFFDHYREADYDECKNACSKVDVDFLASLVAYQARQLEHWEEYYGTDVYNFFIAGIETLIEKNKI